MNPLIRYIVPAGFNAIGNLNGRYILYGDDYTVLSAQQRRYGDAVEGLILTGRGPFRAIQPLPGCHLIINLDHNITPLALEIPDRPDPATISFTVDQADAALPAAIQLSRLPVELDLALSLEHLDRCVLDKILKLYLHEPANRLKLQPLHAILDALYHKKRISLWDGLWANPNHFRHISGQDLIHPRGNGIIVRIGSYQDRRCRFSQEGRRLIKLSRHSFAENSSCRQCPFYFICGGCIQALYGRCENWTYLLGRLQKAAHQLAADRALSPDN